MRSCAWAGTKDYSVARNAGRVGTPVERRVYGLKCCVLPSRSSLFGDYRSFGSLTNWRSILSNRKPLPSPASNTVSGNLHNGRRSREISKNQPRSRRSRKIPKPRSDMINVRFIVMYRWKIWDTKGRRRRRNGGWRSEVGLRLEFHNATNTIAYRYRLSFRSLASAPGGNRPRRVPRWRNS